MMRSLWTASSGMLSQQTNLDTIAHNLSNINTVGYKKETAEFKSLLYQTIREASTDSEGNPKATAIQVGSGVRNSAIQSIFVQGPLTASDGPFDLGIQGNGFFMVRDTAGETAYTRSGAFQASVAAGGKVILATSDGNPVLDNQGKEIVLWQRQDAGTGTNAAGNAGTNNTTAAEAQNWSVNDIIVYENGQVVRVVRTKVRVDQNGKEVVQTPDQPVDMKNTREVEKVSYVDVAKLGVAQFNNPSGLIKAGGSLLYQSDASGAARIEGQDTGLKQSVVKQGYLEASNVQAVDEMVNMIVAQRAYELNSKIITASDEMLQQANNLRR